MKRASYPAEFKAKLVIEAMREEKMLSQIASENSIHPSLLSKWKAEAIAGMPKLFQETASEEDKIKVGYEAKIKELYEQIGKLTIDLDWLKKKSGIR